jgi:hypothetical protein
MINTGGGACPDCGGRLSFPDSFTDESGNVHEYVKRTWDFLIRPEVIPYLDELRVEIENAQQQNIAPTEVVSNIKKSNPVFAALVVLLSLYLVPKSSGDFYQMLSFILQAIMFIQGQPNPNNLPEKPPQIIINQTFNIINEPTHTKTKQASPPPMNRHERRTQKANNRKKNKIAR